MRLKWRDGFWRLGVVVGHALITPPRYLIEERFRTWSATDQTDFVQKTEVAAKAYWDNVKASPLFPYLSAWEVVAFSAFFHSDRPGTWLTF
jgi:hypothetical protein